MANTLGTVLKDARKSRGKTLRSFATELKISAALLSMIEQDKHLPTQELIVDAAKRLDGDADQWCGLAGKLTPSAEKSLSDLATENPQFFRIMLNGLGGVRK